MNGLCMICRKVSDWEAGTWNWSARLKCCIEGKYYPHFITDSDASVSRQMKVDRVEPNVKLYTVSRQTKVDLL